MIVVFDSNIWISALHFRGLPLQAVEQAFIAGEIAFCDEIVEEVRRSLATKFGWNRARLARDFGRLLTHAHKTELVGSIHGVCRDPADDMVLECAISAGADVIVSGDRDLLSLKSYKGIRVLTAREYLAIRAR